MSVQMARLGDIAEDLRSGFACGVDDPDGVIQFRMNNVERDGTLNWTKTRRVPRTIVKSGLTLQSKDILLNATNSPDLVGKTALFVGADEPITFSNHFLRLRMRTKAADPAYVARWLRRQFELGNFKAMCRSWVNQASITRDQVSNLEIPLPPLNEQNRIAAILDKADQLRQKRRQAIALLDSLSQSIFLEMFGDPTEGSSFVSSTLGEACIKITDGEHQNPDFTQDGMPIVMASQVGERFVDASNAKFVSNADGARFRKKCGPEQGDILVVGRGATIGRATMVDTDVPFCLMGSVILLKPNRSVILPTVLQSWVKNPKIRAQLYKTSSSSAQQAIYLSHIKKLHISIPPMREQAIFSERVSNLLPLIKKSDASAISSETLFASLQHRAFTGQL